MEIPKLIVYHLPTNVNQKASATMSSGRRASHEDPPVPADQLLRDANGQPISAAEHEQHPRPSAWERVNETWTLEVLGFVLAALCLVGTVVLLRVFDGQRVPDWPVTLNFVLSLLANVAFAATMLGVQSSLGQLKWLRFAGGPRPLAEIAAFQGARSPLGALRLTLAAGFRFVAGSKTIGDPFPSANIEWITALWLWAWLSPSFSVLSGAPSRKTSSSTRMGT